VIEWDPGPYQYDGAGNIKQIGSDAYRYDAHNRLVSASVASHNVPGASWDLEYIYDGFGNLTEYSDGVDHVFSVNPVTNRVQSWAEHGSTLYATYDAAGNMTSDGASGYGIRPTV
jgi:hypothetical protein